MALIEHPEETGNDIGRSSIPHRTVIDCRAVEQGELATRVARALDPRVPCSNRELMNIGRATCLTLRISPKH